MNRLVATHADLGYAHRNVLADLSLELRPGEVLVLIGPNGAGKTTLLRALARQLRPTAGAIHLGGAALWDCRPGWAAQRIGLALQGRTTDRPITVIETVALGRAPHRGWLLPLRPDDRRAIDRALARVGLADLAERPVTEHSDGEAQRVGLARALAQQPAVLMVDEPTAHLDLRYQGEVLDLLRELSRDGLAVAAVLHDLNLAALWGDRIALLAHGRLAAVGSPEEVLTAERLSAAYQTPLDVARHPTFGTPLIMPATRIIRRA